MSVRRYLAGKLQRCLTDRQVGTGRIALPLRKLSPGTGEHVEPGQQALVAFIALINATNRFAVINRQRGGDYQPAQP